MINAAVLTWRWLLNEETVKLSYSSFEWHLWHRWKLGGRCYFMDQQCPHVWVWAHCDIENITPVLRSVVILNRPNRVSVHFIWLPLFLPLSGEVADTSLTLRLFRTTPHTHLRLRNSFPSGTNWPINSLQTDKPPNHYSDHNSSSSIGDIKYVFICALACVCMNARLGNLLRMSCPRLWKIIHFSWGGFGSEEATQAEDVQRQSDWKVDKRKA